METGITVDHLKVAGYAHPLYSQSLANFGLPVHLPCSGGWVLDRKVPGFPDRDAMGPYPLFACRDWSQLASDLAGIGDRWVSLAIVSDPFGSYTPDLLKRAFIDVVFPFKEHYVVDLSRPLASFVSSHHQRNARASLREVEVLPCDNLHQVTETWTALYGTLIERHHIRGIPAFSRSSFDLQLQIPGLVSFQAIAGGITVGMILWYVMNDTGYYHLAAYSEQGYSLKASFALFWRSLDHFADLGLKWLCLGAGAGVEGSAADGLSRFKRGWSTGTRTAYFCGRIFQPERYNQLAAARSRTGSRYFPAYRQGEFD
jgi:hypothetical protein